MGKIKLINSKPLNSTDQIIIAIHLLASIGMWLCYKKQLLPIESLKSVVSMYFFMMPILLVGGFFRNLRNINFYLIWVIFGIAQFMIYADLIRLSEFNYYRGSAFSGLRALLPTVLIYQILRVIFIKIYDLEMIISIRQGRMSRWEEEENRNMTWLEVAFSLILALTTVFCNVVD